MSQKKAKLMRKFARLTGADQLGSVSVVPIVDKITGVTKDHRAFHSHSRELKREYAGANISGKAMLSGLHRETIKILESKEKTK